MCLNIDDVFYKNYTERYLPELMKFENIRKIFYCITSIVFITQVLCIAGSIIVLSISYFFSKEDLLLHLFFMGVIILSAFCMNWNFKYFIGKVYAHFVKGGIDILFQGFPFEIKRLPLWHYNKRDFISDSILRRSGLLPKISKDSISRKFSDDTFIGNSKGVEFKISEGILSDSRRVCLIYFKTKKI